MTPEEVQQLLDKYVSEELSREEFVALWQTVSAADHRLLWEHQVDELLLNGGYEELAPQKQQELILASILHETQQTPVRSLPNKKFWWAAASVVLMLSAGAYFWFIAPEKKPQSAEKLIMPGDLPPGKDGAVLTLADGATIVLDSVGAGLVATENGSVVTLKDNALAYAPAAGRKDTVTYNTLSTPRGRQFHLQLSDGTIVWLNAASSIRYPTAFTGSKRKVSITGEAWFEVAKDQRKPFLVEVDGKMEIDVLGTSFNVNAYTDEPQISTTLLDGAIRVAMTGKTGSASEENSILLRPGQQVALKEEKLSLRTDPNLKMVMAWKEGYFLFNYTPVTEILRQFARWYDIDIVYEENVPGIVLNGAVRRDFTLTEALMILQKMGLRYRLNEKQLIILK